jgi:hypothetical protein
MKIIINLGREILLLGSVRESIMKPSETSNEKKKFITIIMQNSSKLLVFNNSSRKAQFLGF